MINRILELIEEKGIKQKQFCADIGISTGNFSDWKSGRARPSIEVIPKIADYFNISLDYLLGRSDVRNADYMIELYKTGVFRWMNDRAFKPEEKAILKDHFYELLLRYKEAVNKLANFMYSEDRRMLVASDATCEELSVQTANAILSQLRDLICWIASFPFDYNKLAKSEHEDHTDLFLALYEIVGVLPDGYDRHKVNLSDEERDLLEIWSTLDKDGKRILIGTATEQKHRVLSELGSEDVETA